MIGTSGWHYSHWKGVYYPEKMKTKDYLGHYCRDFDTVELNNSFYRLPEAESFRMWHDTVPGNFRFSVKASRYITHVKKLKDAPKHTDIFLERAKELKRRLGPILFQLPGKFGSNPGRLEKLLKHIKGRCGAVFEFRDESWLNNKVFGLLEKYRAGLCIYDMNGRIPALNTTAGHIYVRLHGPGAAYTDSYSAADIKFWSGKIKKWSSEGKDVYCYFNNDAKGYAVRNAFALKQALGIK
ncbi:MAG: DUF72 domain-containing protein [Candidatus Goldiibacteriota bacterium]